MKTQGPVLDFGVLDFGEDAESAPLGTKTVKLVTADLSVEGEAEVKLDLAPVPGLYLHCVFEDPRLLTAMMTAMTEPESLSVLDMKDQRIEGIRSGWKCSLDGTLRLKWLLSSEPVKVAGDDDTQMTEVVAHVFNLEARLWKPSGGTIGVLELSHEPWKARIRLVEDGHQNISELRTRGGLRLTHLVEVEQDGNDFSGKDADNVLLAIRNFLTFAKGGVCDLACPSGRDNSGEEVWARWSSPGQWQRTPWSWFDRSDAEPLAELFPGFMDRWARNGWEDTLRTAIWWYAQANSGSRGIDQGIVTAQIAMERLSYEYCVRERALVSEDGFEKLPAADRYRLLLGSLNIPATLPSNATSLAAVSKEKNWTDAPQALTVIRNRLVHAGRKELKLTDEGYFEAWGLATWLLELAVLALCDFKGEHWNRVKRGKEPVPWAR